MFEITIATLCLIAFAFVFYLFKSWIDARAQARRERMALLQEALSNPDIDREDLETLTYQLTGVRTPPEGATTPRWMAVMLAVGWVGLFLGIGIGVLGDVMRRDEIQGVGVIVGFLGFGVLTLPFAIRELEARSTAQ